MGVGFAAIRPYVAGPVTGNVLERAALTGNGQGAASFEKRDGGQLYNGAGVQVAGGAPRLTSRYVDRTLTSAPLLPWPMEGRAQAELGVSISDIWREYAER